MHPPHHHFFKKIFKAASLSFNDYDTLALWFFKETLYWLQYSKHLLFFFLFFFLSPNAWAYALLKNVFGVRKKEIIIYSIFFYCIKWDYKIYIYWNCLGLRKILTKICYSEFLSSRRFYIGSVNCNLSLSACIQMSDRTCNQPVTFPYDHSIK